MERNRMDEGKGNDNVRLISGGGETERKKKGRGYCRGEDAQRNNRTVSQKVRFLKKYNNALD